MQALQKVIHICKQLWQMKSSDVLYTYRASDTRIHTVTWQVEQ